MSKGAARSRKHATEGSGLASNDVTNLASVEGLQGSSGSGVVAYVVDHAGRPAPAKTEEPR